MCLLYNNNIRKIYIGSSKEEIIMAEQNPAYTFYKKNQSYRLYLPSPPTDIPLEPRFMQFVKIRSGQRMVYSRLGIISRTSKRHGLRLIFNPFGLWGNGIVVHTEKIRNQHIEIKTVQTKDNIELLSATASLFYTIKHPATTVRAAFDDEKKTLAYEDTLNFMAEADLRQFIRGKTLENLNGIPADEQDILSDETWEYMMDDLGIEAHKLLYRRIDLPKELEAGLAEKIIAIQEAEGRLEIARRETKIAEEYAIASKSYRNNPEAMELRRLQSLDNLVETQKANPNLFIGIDPMLGLLGKVAKKE